MNDWTRGRLKGAIKGRPKGFELNGTCGHSLRTRTFFDSSAVYIYVINKTKQNNSAGVINLFAAAARSDQVGCCAQSAAVSSR